MVISVSVWEKQKEKLHIQAHSVNINVYFCCAVDIGIPTGLQADDLWGEGNRKSLSCFKMKIYQIIHFILVTEQR